MKPKLGGSGTKTPKNKPMPKGAASSAGRKKYGNTMMVKMAAKGQKK